MTSNGRKQLSNICFGTLWKKLWFRMPAHCIYHIFMLQMISRFGIFARKTFCVLKKKTFACRSTEFLVISTIIYDALCPLLPSALTLLFVLSNIPHAQVGDRQNRIYTTRLCWEKVKGKKSFNKPQNS